MSQVRLLHDVRIGPDRTLDAGTVLNVLDEQDTDGCVIVALPDDRGMYLLPNRYVARLDDPKGTAHHAK